MRSYNCFSCHIHLKIPLKFKTVWTVFAYIRWICSCFKVSLQIEEVGSPSKEFPTKYHYSSPQVSKYQSRYGKRRFYDTIQPRKHLSPIYLFVGSYGFWQLLFFTRIFASTKMTKNIFHIETRELFKPMKFCVVAFYFVLTSILTPPPPPSLLVMFTLVSVNF